MSLPLAFTEVGDGCRPLAGPGRRPAGPFLLHSGHGTDEPVPAFRPLRCKYRLPCHSTHFLKVMTLRPEAQAVAVETQSVAGFQHAHGNIRWQHDTRCPQGIEYPVLMSRGDNGLPLILILQIHQAAKRTGSVLHMTELNPATINLCRPFSWCEGLLQKFCFQRHVQQPGG